MKFKIFVKDVHSNTGALAMLVTGFDNRIDADYAAEALGKVNSVVTKLYPPAPEICTKGIREIGLTERATNCLFVHGVKTVDDLTKMTRAELEGLYNFGKVSVANVDAFLVRNKLHLAG